jgi:hypothetical protein
VKKTSILFSVVVIFSLLLSACGNPRVLVDPQSYVGNPTDPEEITAAYAAGPIEAQPLFTVDESIVPANVGEIIYAPMGADTDITFILFRPELANEMLMLVPVGAGIAVLDGPQPGPTDVVAALYSAGKVIAVVFVIAVSAYDVYMAFDGIQELTMTLQVGYLPRSGNHNPEHDVEQHLESAMATITALTVWVTSGPGGLGPDNKVRCVVMKAGDAIVRFIIWNQTHLSTMGVPRGDLMWWHASAPEGVQPWADFYPNKSGNTLTNVPQDLSQNSNIRMEEWDCKDFPSPPALPGN